MGGVLGVGSTGGVITGGGDGSVAGVTSHLARSSGDPLRMALECDCDSPSFTGSAMAGATTANTAAAQTPDSNLVLFPTATPLAYTYAAMISGAPDNAQTAAMLQRAMISQLNTMALQGFRCLAAVRVMRPATAFRARLCLLV